MNRTDIAKIREEVPNLTGKLKILGEYVAANPRQVAFMTMRQLAAATRLSDATVMRFINHFGYAGYHDFLDSIRSLLNEEPGPALAAEEGGPLARALAEEYKHLSSLAPGLAGNGELKELVKLLALKPRVHLLATPAGRADAQRLHWALSRLRPGVTLAGQGAFQLDEEILALPQGSLALLIAAGHSTLELLAAAKTIRRAGVLFYLIAEGSANTLAEYGDHIIHLQSRPDQRPSLALPWLINYLVEAAEPDCRLQYHDHQALMAKNVLKHQPLAERRDTLNLAVSHGTSSLEPAGEHTMMRELMIMRCVYQGLVKFEEGSWRVLPSLATSWQTAEDGRSAVFYLRQGVQFHHGFGEFSAEDVKFTFERLARSYGPQSGQPAWRMLREVEVLSRYVVKLVFERPAPMLFSGILTMQPGLIICKQAMERLGQMEYGLRPVGTGPYEVKEFQPRERLELAAFNGYWDTPPLTRKLIFNFGPHLFTLPHNFTKGQLDVAAFPNINAKVGQDTPGLSFRSRPDSQLWWLGLVTTRPPLNNLQVRRAVQLALDVEKIREAAFSAAAPLQAPIPQGVAGHWAEAPKPEYSPAKARELLSKISGLRDRPLVLAADPSEIDILGLEIIKANLAEVGLNVKIELTGRMALLDIIHSHKCDLYLFFYNAPLDPYHTLNWFTSGQYYNLSHWNDPAYDAVIAAMAGEMDDNKRLELALEAQRLIVEAAWGVWLAQGQNVILSRSNVDLGPIQPNGFLNPWVMAKRF